MAAAGNASYSEGEGCNSSDDSGGNDEGGEGVDNSEPRRPLFFLSSLSLELASSSDVLTNWTVDESYLLTIEGCSAVIQSPTPFGALRGLETFYQLAAPGIDGSAALPHTHISIVDQPKFSHRALMLDIGRRLYPLAFVRSIIDAMSYAKMNVLHLHLSDFGRFSWESIKFPELNVGYRGDGKFWTQGEIRELIAYALLRGVRIIPEIELSTHARALYPLKATRGLEFCNDSFPAMLYDDPVGKTFDVLKVLLTEMANLFVDDVLHVGMDEAQCHFSSPKSRDPLDIGYCGLQHPPRCNQHTVRRLQHKVLRWVAEELLPQRRPMAWGNVITDCGDYNGCNISGHPAISAEGVPSTIVQQ